MNNKQGFTLIELLIVITIVAILSALAYPSYLSYIIQTRRAEAQTELVKAQLKQSSINILGAYSAVSNSVGLPTTHDYYHFSVVSAGSRTYLMKAVAKIATTQVQDELICQTLFIDQNNNHTSDGSTSNEQCW